MSQWVKFPWRKVTSSEQAPGWWNYGPGQRLDWEVNAECGHTLNRRCVKPPRKVRCEACMPVDNDDSPPHNTEQCPTCRKTLKWSTSRHKCPHGVWCGIEGRPQLDYRSRTCEKCNDEIMRIARWTT